MNEYIDLYAISPTKVVKMVKLREKWFNKEKKDSNTNVSDNKNTLEKKFHNFELSVNSRRNLRKKITYLFQFADEKKVISRNKKIFKFKIAFITLTLSSKQLHPTSIIVKKIFQPFLDRCRKLFEMTNYVYRVEFQKNGNVHFHLVTDCYIDYYKLRKTWNECQNYLDYHKRYVDEMKSITFKEFLLKKKGFYKGILQDYSDAKKGKSIANSVDVRVARSNTNIENYISKYFSKKNGSVKCNDLDNEDNSFALRLCFWSRSLSKCDSTLMPFDYYPFVHVFETIREWGGVVERWYDYCKVLYINHYKLEWNKRELWSRLWNYFRENWGYVPWNGDNCKYIVN